ncbi:MAG: ABC transporter ATP-binding protein [Eubacteriales bacterium]
MLEIKNISKTYSKGKVKAVDNISFTHKEGEILGFLGPNGAGKTTTIKMIVGLLKPDEGSIMINGIDNQQNPIQAKKSFGYVPDNPQIYERLRGIEYLKFISDVFQIPKEEREASIKKYSDVFNLTHALNDMVNSYSHGMKQKLALISALIHKPDLFILDEPMVGLDPKSSFKLKEIMRDHCDEGKSVFFSTHVLEVAEKICDRIAIINEGKIIALGTMEELKEKAGKEETLENIFLEVTDNESNNPFIED